MSTTEVVIEQVLTGVLVLLVVAASFDSSHWHVAADLLRSPTASVALIGLAYLLGVPFDRFADSLLQDLEARARVGFAWNHVKNQKLSEHRCGDPFPEHALRVELHQHGNEGPRAYMEYLRTRMRIARALAVYVPGIMLALLLRPAQGEGAVVFTLVATAAVYLVFFAVTFGWAAKDCPTDESVLSPCDEVKTDRLGDWICAQLRDSNKPPAADANTSQKAGAHGVCARSEPCEPKLGKVVNEKMVESWLCPLRNWTLRIAAGIAGVLLCKVLLVRSRAEAAMLFAGCFVTVVSGYAWWRISKTFYRLLVDFAAMRDSERSGLRRI